jgi:hypothetical protein
MEAELGRKTAGNVDRDAASVAGSGDEWNQKVAIARSPLCIIGMRACTLAQGC